MFAKGAVVPSRCSKDFGRGTVLATRTDSTLSHAVKVRLRISYHPTCTSDRSCFRTVQLSAPANEHAINSQYPICIGRFPNEHVLCLQKALALEAVAPSRCSKDFGRGSVLATRTDSTTSHTAKVRLRISYHPTCSPDHYRY